MDDERQRPGEGTLRAVAADKIGQDPRQLDLWPAPKGIAFSRAPAALGRRDGAGRCLDNVRAGRGSDRAVQAKFLLLDSTGVPAAQPRADWDEIRITDGDEFAGSAPAAFTRAFRPGVVAGALAAALALGWAVGWGSYHMLTRPPVAAPLKQVSVSDCALDAGKETSCAAPKSDREALPAAANAQKPSGAAANAAGRGRETARGSPPHAAPASRESVTAPQHTGTVPTAGQQFAKLSPRPMPVPETRPTTIEGWTVREVAGATVVLEGPDGTWRAARGDTVPGVGRVDSIVRWGNRWIVATTRGLISTQN
jgi:hypothetical protein